MFDILKRQTVIDIIIDELNDCNMEEFQWFSQALGIPMDPDAIYEYMVDKGEIEEFMIYEYMIGTAELADLMIRAYTTQYFADATKDKLFDYLGVAADEDEVETHIARGIGALHQFITHNYPEIITQ